MSEPARPALTLNNADNTGLQYICASEQALGQITALAATPAPSKPEDVLVLLQRCRTVLRRFEGIQRWGLVSASDLGIETIRADGLQTRLDTMARLADRLAGLEKPLPPFDTSLRKRRTPKHSRGPRMTLNALRINCPWSWRTKNHRRARIEKTQTRQARFLPVLCRLPALGLGHPQHATFR